jgi:hypothetical protein
MAWARLHAVRGIDDAVARRDIVTPFELYAEDIAQVRVVDDHHQAPKPVGLREYAMSHGNVELVRRIYSDGLFDRDPARIVHEFATPDIEYSNPPEAVEPGLRRGRAQVAQALRSSSELFNWSRHEVHELFDCEDAVR